MTPDAVAVITYPGHCISTVLTIKNLYQLTQWQVPCYLFIDDIGEQYYQWEGNYLDDIKRFYYEQLNVDLRFVLFSEFGFKKIWDGWLRQQLVKLNIDQFMPKSLWYVTDGDVQLNKTCDFTVSPYNFVPHYNRDVYAQNCTYIKYMLQLNNVVRTHDNREIFSHHAPFRWIGRDVLVGLRKYVEDCLDEDFNELHWRLMKELKILGLGTTNDNMSMTEWDLLEAYKHFILDETLNLEFWPTGEDFQTFFGTDKDVDNSWYAQYNIKVPQDIQEKILTISRT
jgi:hypothetical protein